MYCVLPMCKIDHFTHVTVIVAQYISKSEYNSACIVGMALAHFIMLNNYLMNKDPDVVPEQELVIILDRKSSLCMASNGKYTKHTRNISRRIKFVINGEDFNLHKTVWCEGGLKFSDILTNNVRED